MKEFPAVGFELKFLKCVKNEHVTKNSYLPLYEIHFSKHPDEILVI